jgi:hypothetical protein
MSRNQELTWIESEAFAHYREWECYSAGFWNQCSGATHSEKSIASSARLLSDRIKFAAMCVQVSEQWPVSAGVHYTSQGKNSKSYLGQAACFIYCGSLRCCTAAAWWTLSERERTIANKIAQAEIDQWLLENVNCQSQNAQLAFQF